MNCKEFEKNIPDFIAGKLDFQTLQEFGEHMRECPGCKEELVIQFLVTEGMQRQPGILPHTGSPGPIRLRYHDL